MVYWDQILQKLPSQPLLEGRKDWVEAEDYGHNGVLHIETTPIIGYSNPVSPKLSIWIDDQQVRGKLIFDWMFEGGNHRAHGGSIAAVFDEFMATAMSLTGKTGVTAYLKTDYLSFTPINQELQLNAKIRQIEGKKVFVDGQMWAGEKQTASCEALFILQEKIPVRG